MLGTCIKASKQGYAFYAETTEETKMITENKKDKPEVKHICTNCYASENVKVKVGNVYWYCVDCYSAMYGGM